MYNHLTVYTVLQYNVAYRMHVQYVVKKLMAELTNSTRNISEFDRFTSFLASLAARVKGVKPILLTMSVSGFEHSHGQRQPISRIRSYMS